MSPSQASLSRVCAVDIEARGRRAADGSGSAVRPDARGAKGPSTGRARLRFGYGTDNLPPGWPGVWLRAAMAAARRAADLEMMGMSGSPRGFSGTVGARFLF